MTTIPQVEEETPIGLLMMQWADAVRMRKAAGQEIDRRQAELWQAQHRWGELDVQISQLMRRIQQALEGEGTDGDV